MNKLQYLGLLLAAFAGGSVVTMVKDFVAGGARADGIVEESAATNNPVPERTTVQDMVTKSDDVTGVVKARKFELVDRNGITKGVWSTAGTMSDLDDKGVFLQFWSGDELMEGGMVALTAREKNSHICLTHDKKTKAQISYQHEAYGKTRPHSMLSLNTGEHGKAQLTATVEGRGSGLMFIDSEGRATAFYDSKR